MSVKLLQFLNTRSPMLVTLSGILTLAKLSQPQNRKLWISVMLLGKSIFFRLVHHINARAPRLVTLSGMLIVVRLVQLVNALFPIYVTLLGIVISVTLLQSEKA